MGNRYSTSCTKTQDEEPESVFRRCSEALCADVVCVGTLTRCERPSPLQATLSLFHTMMCSTGDGNNPLSDVNWTSATKRISLRHGALRQLTDAYHECMEIETVKNEMVLISGPSGGKR